MPLAWDSVSGEPLAPVLGWQDRRTLDRVNELRAMGIPVNTLAACTRFEWLLQQPSIRAAADAGRLRLGTPDAWLTWCLSAGEAFVTDPSNAGATGLIDPEGNDWFDAALELFGQRRAWLPRLVATDAVVGRTDSGLLGASIPLAARAGDQQAACRAQGMHAPGDAKLTLGTSGMLDRCTGAAAEEAPDGAYALPLWRLEELGSAWCLEGTLITAGAAVDWLVRVGLLESADQLDAVAGSARPGVLFVPALAGLGTPWMEDGVRARFDGIGLDTGPAQLVRGVVDGIAHRVVDLMETLDVRKECAVDGGWHAATCCCSGSVTSLPAASPEPRKRRPRRAVQLPLPQRRRASGAMHCRRPSPRGSSSPPAMPPRCAAMSAVAGPKPSAAWWCLRASSAGRVALDTHRSLSAPPPGHPRETSWVS
ncbi:MAG: FGGY family carbohydrate kinase [Gammaproteobacteria bacterium]|nr:FGGY family carbohydrate kinase [Gammaproteobacteria bacterium]